MRLRFRRTAKVAPGLRLSLTKRGVGLRAGPPGVGASFHSSGRRTVSAGIPGTGLHVRSDRSGRRRQASSGGGHVNASSPPSSGRQRPPGRFASRADRELYAACVDGDHHRILATGDLSPDTHRQIADVFAAVVGRPPAEVVAGLLIPLWDQRFDPAAHRFCRRWLSPPIVVGANGGLSTTVPLNGNSVGLLAARAASSAGLTAESLRIAGELPESPLAALARVEAAAAAEDWQAAADLADGAPPSNTSIGLAVSGWQAEAHRRLGRTVAARQHLQPLQRAARAANAPSELVSWMLTLRARVAADEGRIAQAWKDYERARQLDAHNPQLNETYEVVVDADRR